MHDASCMIWGHAKVDMDKYNRCVKQMKDCAKVLDKFLKGREWINNDHFTLADVFVGSAMIPAFQLIFDPGFRKAMPNLTKWFDRFCMDPFVKRRYGVIMPCMKVMKPPGAETKSAAPAKKAKKEVAEVKLDVDEDLDLFGDDNEDDAAAAKEAIAKAKSQPKKAKKVVIAQSLVLFEVKPLDNETDLDVLGARILGLTGDGIYWKSEFKKEPVAYGIFKIIIGVTVEDDKVSVDALQEQIEAFDDMVQSVEIAAFNKI
jgi:translation elongation factor EF-1beta